MPGHLYEYILYHTILYSSNNNNNNDNHIANTNTSNNIPGHRRAHADGLARHASPDPLCADLPLARARLGSSRASNSVSSGNRRPAFFLLSAAAVTLKQ